MISFCGINFLCFLSAPSSSPTLPGFAGCVSYSTYEFAIILSFSCPVLEALFHQHQHPFLNPHTHRTHTHPPNMTRCLMITDKAGYKFYSPFSLPSPPLFFHPSTRAQQRPRISSSRSFLFPLTLCIRQNRRLREFPIRAREHILPFRAFAGHGTNRNTVPNLAIEEFLRTKSQQSIAWACKIWEGMGSICGIVDAFDSALQGRFGKFVLNVKYFPIES